VPVFLLAIFGAACILLLAPALRSRCGVLEFPFAAGCGLLGFLFPQAAGIVLHGDPVPRDGLVKALAMCTLAALAVYAGWHEPAPARWSAPREFPYPAGRLYWIGLLCLAVGLAGFLKLASLSGGVVAHYSTHGNYALEWRGMPVVWDFFVQYLTPGLALCGLAGLLLGGRMRLTPPAIALSVQLASIVFLGRRAVLVSVVASVGCVLYFARRWLPPWWMILGAAPVLALAMFIAPEYRKHSQIGGDVERLADLDAGGLLGTTGDGREHEFWALANYIHSTDEDGLYEYGAGVYNVFIQLFVPKLIVGEAGKAAMMIPTREAAAGWNMPYGMVPTGPGSAYRQFWFLGCVWFYGLSRLMRYLWLRAVAGGDIIAQTVYVYLLTPAIASVVNDMYAFYVPVFMFWIPLAVITAGVLPGPVMRPRRLRPAGAMR
jgi:hypothetical protein